MKNRRASQLRFTDLCVPSMHGNQTGFKSPVCRMELKQGLPEANCGRVTDRGEAGYGKVIEPTNKKPAYEADREWEELAQHSEVPSIQSWR